MISPRFAGFYPEPTAKDTNQVKAYLEQATRPASEGWVFLSADVQAASGVDSFLARTDGVHQAVRNRLQVIREQFLPGYNQPGQPLLGHLLQAGIEKEQAVELSKLLLTEFYGKVVTALAQFHHDPANGSDKPAASASINPENESAQGKLSTIADQIFPIRSGDSIVTLLHRLGVSSRQLDEITETAQEALKALNRWVGEKNKAAQQDKATVAVYQPYEGPIRLLKLPDQHEITGLMLLRKLNQLSTRSTRVTRLLGQTPVEMATLMAALPDQSSDYTQFTRRRLHLLRQQGLVEEQSPPQSGLLQYWRLTSEGQKVARCEKDLFEVIQITPQETKAYLDDEIKRLQSTRAQQLNTLKTLEAQFLMQRESIQKDLEKETGLRTQLETPDKRQPATRRQLGELETLTLSNQVKRDWLAQQEQRILLAQERFRAGSRTVDETILRLEQAKVEVDLTAQSTELAELCNGMGGNAPTVSQSIDSILAGVQAAYYKAGALLDFKAEQGLGIEAMQADAIIAQRLAADSAGEQVGQPYVSQYRPIDEMLQNG
jgi:hypothetical protein